MGRYASADEKMQREPDLNRVVNEIVPYYISDEDRFFSSIVVDVYSGFSNLVYEPATNIINNLPAAYQLTLKDVGFLTLQGNERLIALDGHTESWRLSWRLRVKLLFRPIF